MSKKRKTKEELYMGIRKQIPKPSVVHQNKRKKQVDSNHRDEMRDH